MRNYQKELDAIIEANVRDGAVPTLLLHACCAPCSSYCLEYLSQFFKITLFYYNPNIDPAEEYAHRVAEAKRLVAELQTKYPVEFLEGRFDPQEFYDAVRGFEVEPEGCARCALCFRLRLTEAAKAAKDGGFDFFTTTLSISPLKNAATLNEEGERAAALFDVRYLPSDFKKRGGYQRSIELSRVYDLYRQDYCGCVYSKRRDLKR